MLAKHLGLGFRGWYLTACSVSGALGSGPDGLVEEIIALAFLSLPAVWLFSPGTCPADRRKPPSTRPRKHDLKAAEL